MLGTLDPVGLVRRGYRTTRITTELVWFIASPRKRQDPFPAYRKLQAMEPVHRSPIGVWVLSSHADVLAALRDPRLSSDERHIDLATLHIGPLRQILGRDRPERTGPRPYFDRVERLMLFQDPPTHTRLRHAANRAFTPRRVRDLEGRIQVIADRLLDEMLPAGDGDLMRAFAYPFPAEVIGELIGVPAEDAHHLIDNAPALAAGLDPGPLLTSEAREAADAATLAIVAYVEDLIARRRVAPRDDLFSTLLGGDPEDALDQDDLVNLILLLLIAGHETTANLLGNGVVALLADPPALASLRADPALDDAAVDELLRFDAPVQLTMRIATEDLMVGDHLVAAGTVVICCTGAANRDPAVFPHPDRLDWRRADNPHLAFGGGIHYCLGAALARTEARIGLRAILDRTPGLRLDGTPVRRPSFTIRGLAELPLAWDPPA